MTIKPIPEEYQPLLLDVPQTKQIDPGGEARTRYGRVVEKAVIRLLDLQDIPNSGNYDVVYDAGKRHDDRDLYYEIKSLRRNNKCPIYDWRLKKDAESKVNPVYLIAVHDCKKMPDMVELWQGMAETMTDIYALSLPTITRLANNEPLKEIKTVSTESGPRNGYQRKGYREGYRNIPFQTIASLPFYYPVEREAIIFNHKFKVKLHVDTHIPLDHRLWLR